MCFMLVINFSASKLATSYLLFHRLVYWFTLVSVSFFFVCSFVYTSWTRADNTWIPDLRAERKGRSGLWTKDDSINIGYYETLV